FPDFDARCPMTNVSAKSDAAPALRPYLAATAGFAKGDGSPRDFLERAIAALEAWEPKIGAFVTLDLAGARAAADRAGARWRGGIAVGIGTQVLGSIVRPASFCGCFGFKPTVGAINRGGSYDGLSQSVHGPLAASLPEAWVVAYEIAQRCGGDPGYPGLYGPS